VGVVGQCLGVVKGTSAFDPSTRFDVKVTSSLGRYFVRCEIRWELSTACWELSGTTHGNWDDNSQMVRDNSQLCKKKVGVVNP
jgi:hypothetical protein